MNRDQRRNAFETYCDAVFTTCEGEQGYSNIEELCETLGYGEGWMRGRAVEEFLTDNPGAVEKLLEFIGEWVERNDDWAQKLKDVVEEHEED